MNERPFEDHTRWQSAIGPFVMAALCLVLVALGAAVAIRAGVGAPIGIVGLLSALVWTGLGAVMVRVGLPFRASIVVDELGIKVGRLALPWAAVQAIGVRRWRGRDHVLLRPASDAPLPDRLPPRVHLRPGQRVLILELDGWRHPDQLRTALQAFAGDRWERPQLLPPR